MRGTRRPVAVSAVVPRGSTAVDSDSFHAT
jgi:hypothetical protein